MDSQLEQDQSVYEKKNVQPYPVDSQYIQKITKHQSNPSNIHKKTGRVGVGRERAWKANGIDPYHPPGYSSGPQDANKHFESRLRPPWNLQMVYSGICFTLAAFHRY